jgi:hypothetical protein
MLDCVRGCFRVIRYLVLARTCARAFAFLVRRQRHVNTVYKFLFTGALGGVVTKAGERLMGQQRDKLG